MAEGRRQDRTMQWNEWLAIAILLVWLFAIAL